MGLAQVIERPRNWQSHSSTINDTISITDDGDFFTFSGQQTLNGTEAIRRTYYRSPIVVTSFGFSFTANNLDALSVNTLTLRVDGSSIAGAVVTITDSSPTSTNIEITGLSAAVAAGEGIAVLWNSDSVGTIIARSISIMYRTVNPQA